MASPGTERRLARDDGFTLVELLVATLIGFVVVGGAVSVFVSGVRSEPRARERAAEIQQARTMAETLSRELRQGSNALSTSAANLTVLTYVPHASCGSGTVGAATRCKIFYSCSSAGACTRTECGPNTTVVGPGCGTTTTVVSGLMDNSVFAFTPRTPGQAYVSVRLAFPATGGDDAITIQDGVALRNPPLGSS